METETLILKTNLSNIFNPHMIHWLCRDGYRNTGNKFSLQFNGSKGYLDHIAIVCEGFQKENNRIGFDEIFTKSFGIKKKMLNVYHSEINGVRISFGADKPRVIRPEQESEVQSNVDESADEGLPF